MRTSAQGILALTLFEKYRQFKYQDSGSKWTFGVGHLLTTEEIAVDAVNVGDISYPISNGIPLPDAQNLLRNDLIAVENFIIEKVRVELSQCQFDALVCLAFNVGIGNFGKSTLLLVLNKLRYGEVPGQIMKWDYATINGQRMKVPGLTRRRQAEVEIWKGNYPKTF